MTAHVMNSLPMMEATVATYFNEYGNITTSEHANSVAPLPLHRLRSQHELDLDEEPTNNTSLLGYTFAATIIIGITAVFAAVFLAI